jgi:hypothetical protein
MKRTTVLAVSLTILSVFLWIGLAQSSPSWTLAKLAPPTNVRVEAGENAIKVSWDASPDEGGRDLAGYNVYFDTKSSVLFSPDSLGYAVQLRKNAHEYVVRGLENDRAYFFHVRSRKTDGSISAAGLPEKAATVEPEGKNYAVSMYDNDVPGTPGNSGYGWSRENGQGIPGYQKVIQNGGDVNILMMELPSSKTKSVLISPSEADFTKGWALRNKTRIADIGTNWMVEDSLPDSAFTSTAEIKNGHVYVLKTHDDYYVKLRIVSVEEVSLLLPAGAKHRDVSINRIRFTYVSQLGQSYQHFLTGKP